MTALQNVTYEQWGLFSAIIVQIATILAQQIYTDVVYGAKYSLSSRSDENLLEANVKDTTPTFLRFKRCVNNGVENLVMFTAAVLLASSRGHSNRATKAFAITYPAARAVYSIAYTCNVEFGLRSLAWLIGTICYLAIAISTVAA
eukprot:TRINITY_DN11159_c0_g1_i1.p1 TRINITY_DN11159_c0_g1~~TRINITY_DN11159_c0_g1_i1.p1  ORF type:complete len:145 (+),score=22.80 TRINITY_DN11159_c0_g1_i1:241-675(+)